MNNAAVDIKDYLVTGALGVFAAPTGWSINIGTIPSNPDTTISVIEVGTRKIQTLGRTIEAEVGSIQIRVTSNYYVTAYAKAADIINYLKNGYNCSINSTVYKKFENFEGPVFYAKDEENRYVWLIDFEYVRQA
jgi:hypothetical protein